MSLRSEPTALPGIGIIIPAYNAGRYLAATLSSVAAQTRTDWVCLVVDDGSHDDTADIAEGYAAQDGRFRLIRQPNAGVSAARNTGITHLPPETRYVCFLDGDDLWEPDALQVLVAALETYPEAVGAHGLARGIGPDGAAHDSGFDEFGRARYGLRGGRIARLGPDDPTTFECFAIKFTLYPPCLALLRREMLARIGPWDTEMRRGEDWEFFARAARLGPLVFVDRVIAGYRKHGTNVSDTGDSATGHWRRKQRILRRLTAPAASPTQAWLALASFRASNRHTRGARFRAAWGDLQQGRWARGARGIAAGGGLWLGQTVSLLDLLWQRTWARLMHRPT